MAAGSEITALLPIPKQTILRLLKLDCPGEQSHVERRFIKIEKALIQKRLVIEIAIDACTSCTIAALQPAGSRLINVYL